MPTRKTTRRTAQRIRARDRRREQAHAAREANHLEVLKILEIYKQHFEEQATPPLDVPKTPAPKAQPITPEHERPKIQRAGRRLIAPQVRHPAR